MKNALGRARSAIVGRMFGPIGILKVLLSDSRFLLADEGVIHTNRFMILKAWVTVLELARGRLPNLYGPHGGRVFVGFSSFRGFPGLSPYFGLPTRGTSHNNHLVVLNARVTVLEVTSGPVSQHLWSTWWSDF